MASFEVPIGGVHLRKFNLLQLGQDRCSVEAPDTWEFYLGSLRNTKFVLEAASQRGRSI